MPQDTKKDLTEKLKEMTSEIEEIQHGKTISTEVKKVKMVLIEAFDEILDTLEDIRDKFPKIAKVTVENPIKVSNLADIKEITVKRPVWIDQLVTPFPKLLGLLTNILTEVKDIKLPTSAKNPIAVRLSDGEDFYKVDPTTGEQVLVSSSSGGPHGLSFSNIKEEKKPALIDEDRHAQVDVLTLPSITFTPSGTQDVNLTKVSGTAFALGQQLAASSLPVVLTAAQISTLTPLSSVTANAGTNLNTSALLTTAAHDAAFGTAGTADSQVRSVQGISGMTPVQVGDNSSSLTVDAPVGTPVFVRLSDGSAAISTLPVSLASVPSHAVTNAGTFVVQENGAALTALQLIDNAVSGAGFNITQFGGAAVPIGAGTEAAAIRVTLPTDGTGKVGLNAGTNNIGDVDILTIAAGDNNIGNVDIASAIPAGTNNIGDVDILTIAAGDNNIGNVDIASALPAGTNAIGKLAANSGVDIGDVDVTSIIPGTGATNLGKAIDTATGATDTGVLALATRDDVLAALTPADGDNVQQRTDKYGATWVEDVPSEADLATMATTHVKKYYTSAGAATDGIIWSPAAGKRWFVTDIFINVSAAATVTLEDDLGAGDSAVWKAELAANSGWSHSFKTPLYSGEDAADLLITTSAGNVYVTVTGYEI